MPVARKFDHDEAKRRYDAGENILSLSKSFAVSKSSIRRAIFPEVKARMDRAASNHTYNKRVPCRGGCGRKVWMHNKGTNPSGLCPRCYGKSIRKELQHGTEHKYTRDKCRCVKCIAAASAARRARRLKTGAKCPTAYLTTKKQKDCTKME